MISTFVGYLMITYVCATKRYNGHIIIKSLLAGTIPLISVIFQSLPTVVGHRYFQGMRTITAHDVLKICHTAGFL